MPTAVNLGTYITFNFMNYQKKFDNFLHWDKHNANTRTNVLWKKLVPLDISNHLMLVHLSSTTHKHTHTCLCITFLFYFKDLIFQQVNLLVVLQVAHKCQTDTR